jgi:DNA mismatch repair protein MutS
MTFHSILYEPLVGSAQKETPEAPIFFGDLNLDQVIDGITAGKDEYDLKPFFYTPLHDEDAIQYRHEVLRDLEQETLFAQIKTFERNMRNMREHLVQAEKLYYPGQKKAWFLDAVKIYCDTVKGLVRDLAEDDLGSRGFRAFRDYLLDYTQSHRFTALVTETEQLLAALASVHYCLQIKDSTIRVRKYEGEIDYSADVEETFAKFKQGAVKDYRVQFNSWPNMNHVEAKILELVAQLYPDIFSVLDDYCVKNTHYLDDTLAVFDREIQFYVAYLEYLTAFKRVGLNFCYPHISSTCKEVCASDTFDVALAHKLLHENPPIVCNDFFLKDPERIFVVSGPNQGGKTTFARTFGQLHFLASLGCPVPGREAQLFLFDQLFTHFEKEEDIKNLRGKLEDDLVRLHEILTQATPRSIIILNESFTATTLQDAIFLSQKILDSIQQLDALCVCVTFIDELSSLSEKTVSLVSTVVPDNPALRTFKIIRRPADGLAYALSIAEKYRLTHDYLKERINHEGLPPVSGS